MKKNIVIFTLLLVSTIFNNAAAQEKPISFGIKLNANLTNVKVSDTQGKDNKFRAGASLGGYTRFHLSNTLSIQPEVMLGYTEAKVKGAYENVKFKYVSFEVPVYLQANVKTGTGTLTLGVGPHIGYGLSADRRVEQLVQGSSGENTIELDHWYAGGGAMAAYEFKNHVSVNAGYQLGFDFSSRHKYKDVKTQSISLGIGYRF